MTPTRQRNPPATRTASTSHSTAPPLVRPIKVTGVIFRGLHPLAVVPVRDPPGGHCFHCWQYGHSRWVCPQPSRRGYCINCGRRGDEIANCPRCGDWHRARQQEWEARGSPAPGANGTQGRERLHTHEDFPRESQQPLPPARRTRSEEEEAARAQAMPPPPVAPITTPGTTSYLAQILRDTRDVEPELRHQILSVVLGEGAGAGSPDRSDSARPQ